MARNMFKPIKVTPDDLLLDPNNPRLVDDLHLNKKVDDKDVLKRQPGLEAKFSEAGRSGEDFTDIRDLYDSMKRVGYVGIDRIVVRELEGLGKFVVLEGNRRTSAIKRVLKNAKSFSQKEKEDFEQVKHTFEQVDVLQLQTKGLNAEEVEERISIMLGLRHFGSVRDWEPINRAFNAYQNYMSLEPRLNEFKIDNDRCKRVAHQLAVSLTEVKASLKTYITYIQLTEVNASVEEEHYSLISAAIPLGTKYKYFIQDAESYKFSEDSLAKLQALCQFEDRKMLRGQPDKLIVPEPKFFGRLGKLLKHSKVEDSDVIRKRAEDLIHLIEAAGSDEDGKLEMTIEKANSLLTCEINQRNWVVEVEKLLKKREEELPFDKYDGEGNHLKAKEQLESSISLIRKLFGL